MTELNRRDAIKTSVIGIISFVTGILFSPEVARAKIHKKLYAPKNSTLYKSDFTTTPQMLGYITRLEIPPIDGWKPDTYYIVDAAFSNQNPIHRRIFYTGFPKYGKSNAYACITSPVWHNEDILDWYYIKAIREIDMEI